MPQSKNDTRGPPASFSRKQGHLKAAKKPPIEKEKSCLQEDKMTEYPQLQFRERVIQSQFYSIFFSACSPGKKTRFIVKHHVYVVNIMLCS